MKALVSIANDFICCPAQACGRIYKTEMIDSLMNHCKREHSLRITVKSSRVTTEEMRARQRIYSAQYRSKTQAAKMQKERYREPFTEDDADVDTVYGSNSCPVQYHTSSIPGAGNGVFGAVDLLPGDIVTWYWGNFTTDEPADKAYAIAVPGGFIDELQKPQSGEGLGSFVSRESCDIARNRKNCDLVG